MAAVLVLNTPDDGRLRPKHVELLCRNKTCTVLHQVGVSSDSYYDARKHKIKIPYTCGYSFHKIFIHSFLPLACAECDDSLPFSGASSIPLCYVLSPATFPHQLFFHSLSPHLAIYFLVYLSILLFPNSYIMPFREFYFLPFSVHAQTNVIYLTLLFLL